MFPGQRLYPTADFAHHIRCDNHMVRVQKGLQSGMEAGIGTPQQGNGLFPPHHHGKHMPAGGRQVGHVFHIRLIRHRAVSMAHHHS